MKLTLCYAPRTCALVSYVTLTEAGAAFDVQKICAWNRAPEFPQRVDSRQHVPVHDCGGEMNIDPGTPLK